MIRILDKYLIKQVIPVFLFTLGGLAVIIAIADLFAYIHLIVDREIPFIEILMLLLMQIPQGMIYALPVSLLFSICFTMASLYTNNELVAILNSGVSFMRLTRSLILIGLLLSIGSLVFQDMVQIPVSAERNRQLDSIVGRRAPQDDRNITVWDRSGEILYYADRYRDETQVITDATVLIFENENLIKRIDSPEGQFDDQEEIWKFTQARIFTLDNGLSVKSLQEYSNSRLNEPPQYFRGREDNINNMRIEEAAAYIARMRFVDSQIHREGKIDLYERIVFAFTPLLVAFLSVSVGSRLKKNILLLSIFLSLGISVVYYIFEFLMLILARQGFVEPLTGSLLPFGSFFILSIVLYRSAKT